jgi:hypothetical protein
MAGAGRRLLCHARFSLDSKELRTDSAPGAGSHPVRHAGVPFQRIKDVSTFGIWVPGRGYVGLREPAKAASARKFKHPKGSNAIALFG